MINKTLVDGFNVLGIPYSEEIESDFNVYKDLLLEWNQKINITRIENDEEIYVKHYLDSLVLLSCGKDLASKKIIDVGTGGGFPGLPLKIVEKSLKVTLLDSLRKRIDFLDLVSNELKLENVETLHGRAEDIAHDAKYREKFDVCVSRAVASLNVLSELCLPFVKVGGYFASYKSQNIDEELIESEKAISLLGGKIAEVKTINIPNTDIVRKVVIIEKTNKVPKIYPRKAGTPSKKPL